MLTYLTLSLFTKKNSSNLADFQIFFSLFGVVLVRYCSNQLLKCKFALDGAQIASSHKCKKNFLAMYNNLHRMKNIIRLHALPLQ